MEKVDDLDLGTFIVNKLIELKEKYSFVEFENVESVILSKNSVCTEFNSKETHLMQKGNEINLAVLNEVPSLPFIPNGSVVRFAVKLPRKRKAILKDFYFLWEN